MKIEFVRKFRGKEVGTIEDVPNRVAHRFVNKGMAKLVVEKIVKKRTKKKSTKKNIFKQNSRYDD